MSGPEGKPFEIPKASGGTRMLGVPTVADRVAQTVAALALEPRTEAIFHDDSYGYRPERGALDAVAKCRQRCWQKDWVVDLDVRKFSGVCGQPRAGEPVPALRVRHVAGT